MKSKRKKPLYAPARFADAVGAGVEVGAATMATATATGSPPHQDAAADARDGGGADSLDTMAAVQANMRQLLRDATCSDVTLQVGATDGVGSGGTSFGQSVTLIKAHSNVLCAHSPVFRLELASTWKERVAATASGVATVADLKVTYSVSATKAALDFCYSGAIEIAAGDVVEVLDLARHYKISVLADAAAAIIAEQMNVTNVCIFYASAVRFNHTALIESCFSFCEGHFAEVAQESAFSTLPVVVIERCEGHPTICRRVAWNSLTQRLLWSRKCDGSLGPGQAHRFRPAERGRRD